MLTDLRSVNTPPSGKKGYAYRPLGRLALQDANQYHIAYSHNDDGDALARRANLESGPNQPDVRLSSGFSLRWDHRPDFFWRRTMALLVKSPQALATRLTAAKSNARPTC